MKNTIAIIFLVLGLGIIILGLVRKDDQQAAIGIGDAEIQIGKSDSAFNSYWIFGGILAAAGLVIMVTGKKGS
jgi:hypothetical protein